MVILLEDIFGLLTFAVEFISPIHALICLIFIPFQIERLFIETLLGVVQIHRF